MSTVLNRIPLLMTTCLEIREGPIHLHFQEQILFLIPLFSAEALLRPMEAFEWHLSKISVLRMTVLRDIDGIAEVDSSLDWNFQVCA